jgi:4'-phosphopantetheinyl transferase
MPLGNSPFTTIEAVDIWFESLLADDMEYRSFRQLLSDDEIRVARRFVDDRHRIRYAVCHGKMRILLSNYLDIAPRAIHFARAEYGKPYILDACGQPVRLQFNVSHSADRMLLAVGDKTVGVDVEVWNDLHDLNLLVKDCLAEEEQSYWQKLPKNEQVGAFYRFWTRKESFVKALGCGIGMGVSDIVTSTRGKPFFVSLPENSGKGSDWRLFDLELGGKISGALTVQASP